MTRHLFVEAASCASFFDSEEDKNFDENWFWESFSMQDKPETMFSLVFLTNPKPSQVPLVQVSRDTFGNVILGFLNAFSDKTYL